MKTFVSMITRPTAAITGIALGEDRPQLQHDPGHTRCTADQPTPSLRVKWGLTPGERPQTGSPPLVAGGKVFVGAKLGTC